MPTARIDIGNQLGERAFFHARYFLELSPKGFLEANAHLMSTNNDGTYFDCRLRRPMPPHRVPDHSSAGRLRVD